VSCFDWDIIQRRWCGAGCDRAKHVACAFCLAAAALFGRIVFFDSHRFSTFQMPSVTVKDVDQHKFVRAFAAFLKM
jgi:hypothetical protein